MTAHARPRRINVPAYYLARPAGLWLAAFRPRSQDRTPPLASCASRERGSSDGNA